MFKKYVKQFLTDESGMELLQLAIVVVITVGLIGVMTKLMNTVRENISKANDNANTEMQGILRDANSDSCCELWSYFGGILYAEKKNPNMVRNIGNMYIIGNTHIDLC